MKIDIYYFKESANEQLLISDSLKNNDYAVWQSLGTANKFFYIKKKTGKRTNAKIKSDKLIISTKDDNIYFNFGNKFFVLSVNILLLKKCMINFSNTKKRKYLEILYFNEYKNIDARDLFYAAISSEDFYEVIESLNRLADMVKMMTL